MNEEFETKKLMAEINLLAALEEFKIHKNAARDFIKDDQYDLYLYHKKYLKIYLDEIADCKLERLRFIFSQN